MTRRCKGGFAITTTDGPRVYAAGALVGDDDPILHTHGHLFEAVEEQVARQEQTPRSVSAVPVSETATAAPGEVRQVSVSRGRAGRKASEQ